MKNIKFKSIYFEFAIILTGVVWTIVSFQLDYHLDYSSYMKQWSNIAQGGDPYFFTDGKFTDNAYGPLHSLITLFYMIHPNVPRVLFSFSWLVAVFLLFRSFGRLHLKPWHYATLFISLMLNPFTLKLFVLGQNDLMTSALFILSFLFMYYGHERVSAWCLAGAILYKFFPIIFIPFMLVDNRKLAEFSFKTIMNAVRWKFLLHLLIPIALLYGLYFLLYGDTVMVPLQFLFERKSTPVAFPYFLGSITGSAFVNTNSFAILFVGLVLLFAIYLFRKWDVYLMCIFSLVIVCMLSRVFYFPYMVGLLMLLPFYLYLSPPPPPPPTHTSPTIRACVLLYGYYGMLGTIFVMIFFLKKFTDLSINGINDIKGGVYALSNILLVIALLAHKFSNTSTKRSTTEQ